VNEGCGLGHLWEVTIAYTLDQRPYPTPMLTRSTNAGHILIPDGPTVEPCRGWWPTPWCDKCHDAGGGSCGPTTLCDASWATAPPPGASTRRRRLMLGDYATLTPPALFESRRKARGACR